MKLTIYTLMQIDRYSHCFAVLNFANDENEIDSK